MSKIKWAVFGLVIFISSFSVNCQETNSEVVAVVNGTLIDGYGKTPLSKAAVIIRQGKISEVGQQAKIKIPKDAKIIDAQGGAILPGFINAHVHQGYHQDNLRAWAYGGVTTVRDESMPGDVKETLMRRNTELARPEFARIVSASPMITKPLGYGFSFVDSPDEAVMRVNEFIDAGVDQIKFSIEDGYAGTSGLPKLTEAEIRAIVDTAHRRGVRVSVHVTQGKYLEALVQAGVDDVAHVTYDYASDEVITAMVKKGIYWVPTFTVYKNFGAPLDLVVENLSIFVKLGGKVALGNDYAGGPGEFELGIPYYELSMMRRSGMTPMQIIMASTRYAAEVCGRESDLGTIAVGKIGDLLIVAGNPLQDIKALRNIQWVIKEGVVIRKPK